jgi:NADH:ubiquinone oxidoreductase subunit 2 (subunit N)
MAALWQGSDKKQAEGSVAKTNGASAEERLIAVEEPKSEISICAKSDQYSLIAIFSILGGSLLISSLDLLSMYLSIELQSFALYILATLNKEKLSATSAGLKYFLLGSLSSCLILLGSAIIYSYTGLTQFEAINTLLSISVQAPTNSALSAASISNTPFDLTLAALP